jgi:hypothetical protein
MKLCTLILATALLLPAEEVTFVKDIRVQELAQRSITYTTDQTSQEAGFLADSINYNNVEELKDGQIEKIHDALKELTKSDSALLPAIQQNLLQARRNEDVAELDKAKNRQTEVGVKLEELIKAVDVTNVKAEMQFTIDRQKNINNKTQKLADQILGKDRQELSPQENKDLDNLSKEQESMDELVKDLASKELNQPENNLQNEIKQTSDQLAENKLADAMQKQEDILKKLEDMQKGMSQDKKDGKSDQESKEKSDKKNDEKTKGKPQKESKPNEPPTDSDLNQGVLTKIEKSKWAITLLPNERETLASSNNEKFPPKYEVALIKYYSALASL